MYTAAHIEVIRHLKQLLLAGFSAKSASISSDPTALLLQDATVQSSNHGKLQSGK